MIPVSKPYYDDREDRAVVEVLRSGWLGLGPKTEEFEAEFAARVGSKYAVATNSCSAALHIAARILGLKPGDEVIVPTNTFIVTAQVVNYEGAKPVICDIRKEDLLIDWKDAIARANKNTKAIFPVLWAGQPVVPPDDIGVPVVYDCAQAMGANFSAANKTCCWSFHAVKNIATGDGGMLTTDNEETYERAKRLRWFGINASTWDRAKGKSYKWEYDIDEFGYKYHMNDITAALGLIQLEKLNEMQMLRRRHYRHYVERLQGVVEFIPSNEEASMYLFVVKVPRRNELSDHLREKGISTGVHHKPIHLYHFYNEYPLPVAEREWQSILSLPMYPGLRESEVDFVCDEIIKFLK